MRFKEWLDLKKLSDRTIAEYLTYQAKLLRMLEGGKVTQDLVEKFLKQNNNNVARSFLRNYLVHIKKKDLDVPKITGRRPKKKRNFLSPEKYGRLRQYLYSQFPKHMIGIACDLAYSCALRKDEVCNIKIKDFDWETWSENQEGPCRLKIHGKGNKDRYVIVSPKLMAIILNYVGDRDVEQEFMVTKADTWKRYFTRACKRILNESYGLHDLRRARATIWYKKGHDIVTLKNRLGHSSIKTTELYILPEEEEALKRWADEYEAKEETPEED